MTLRDEFESIMTDGGLYSKQQLAQRDELGYYQYDDIEMLYQGFLLGRQNTVSVERYREDVQDAYNEGQSGVFRSEKIHCFEDSQAKRRTEEV